MGAVVSAFQNKLRRDCINKKESETTDLAKTTLGGKYVDNQLFTNKDILLLPTTDFKTLSEEQKSINTCDKNNVIKPNNTPDNPEDFLLDFFSSINESLDNTIPVKYEESDEMKDDTQYEAKLTTDDPFLPIINLLPRLTQDLETRQRRPDPAWFKRNYTTNDTLKKIYQSNTKSTPIKR